MFVFTDKTLMFAVNGILKEEIPHHTLPVLNINSGRLDGCCLCYQKCKKKKGHSGYEQ